MIFNFKNLIYLFYPKRCPFCNKIIDKNLCVCSSCDKNIKRELKVKRIMIKDLDREVICVSPFSYKDPIKTAICDYKFKGILDYSDLFSKEISKVVDAHFKDIDIITAVPLHKLRKKERGFNQSEILASKIGKLIGVPYVGLLVKFKKNKVQHSLPRLEREENVKNVYKAINENKIKGKNILLCDDIVTTGSTLRECAKILFEAGANKVYCATTAKAEFVD